MLSNIDHVPRVLFLGMSGAASVPPLRALLAHPLPVVGVVLPGARGQALTPLVFHPRPVSELPLLTPYLAPTVAHLAWERGIAVWEMGDPGGADTLETLGALRPDVVVVACFPHKLPASFLALAPLGCLNIHPSRLPAHRGPTPLFWALRYGEPSTGVTVHLMDEGLDTGPLVCQAPLPLPPDITGEELEAQAAHLGGQLVLQAIEGLARQTLTPLPQFSQPLGGRAFSQPLVLATPPDQQPPGQQFFEPAPTPADCVITPAWSAQHAYTFVRAAAPWAPGFTLAVAGRQWAIHQALGYDAAGTLDRVLVVDGAHLTVRCTPGLLHLRASPLRS